MSDYILVQDSLNKTYIDYGRGLVKKICHSGEVASLEAKYLEYFSKAGLSPDLVRCKDNVVVSRFSETRSFGLKEKFEVIKKTKDMVFGFKQRQVSFRSKLINALESRMISSSERKIMSRRIEDLECFLRADRQGFCHGDFHNNNIVGVVRPLLIDFEHSGVGDYMWDIVSISAANVLFSGWTLDDIYSEWVFGEQEFNCFIANFKHRVTFSAINMLERAEKTKDNRIFFEFEKRKDCLLSGDIGELWEDVNDCL